MFAISDYLSKHQSLIDAKSPRAHAVIALLSEIFAMEETIAETHTDNKIPFNKKVFIVFETLWGFVHM